MKNTIYCRTTAQGVHSFYVRADGESYYLFSQNYRKGVNNFYKDGVSIDRAIDRSLGNHDFSILNTMEKLPSYIRYIEKEYGVTVLKQTEKKNKNKHVSKSREYKYAEISARKERYSEELYFEERISA